VPSSQQQQQQQQGGGGGHHAGNAGARANGHAPGAANGTSSSSGGAKLALPRGEVLLLGGDLAYPNPSRETFEQRLFVPFQEALPPPPHYHPGACAPRRVVRWCLLS
jgi:hypothetical protein